MSGPLTAEREAEIRRTIRERFEAGEYDYAGRDLLDALDYERAQVERSRFRPIEFAPARAEVASALRALEGVAFDGKRVLDAICDEDIEDAERAVIDAALAWCHGPADTNGDALLQTAAANLRAARERAGR